MANLNISCPNSHFSLTPGFSPALKVEAKFKLFQQLDREPGALSTGLKPGVNGITKPS